MYKTPLMTEEFTEFTCFILFIIIFLKSLALSVMHMTNDCILFGFRKCFSHSESQRVVAHLISEVGTLNSEVSASEVRG